MVLTQSRTETTLIGETIAVNTTRLLLGSVLMTLFLTGCTLAPLIDGGEDGGAVDSPPVVSASEGLIVQIVDNVQPSVVSVLVPGGGQGSGVIWNSDGVIVTNNHVVDGSQQVEVAFADGQRSKAQVLATDPRNDLAVLQADRNNLPAARFAEELPRVGELAVAMGNPLGFQNSVTAGIVSGLNRSIPGSATAGEVSLVDLLQTDAPISPGNSGGALVGPDGQIIGINVAYIPPSASAVSLGFAIPAPRVADVVTQLLEDGVVEHPYLGVTPETLTPQVAEQFGLQAERGALVVDVAQDTPAAQADIRPGDIIVALDDNAVNSAEDLLGSLRGRKPGDTISLKVLRGDQEQVVEVTLSQRPAE